VVCAHALTPESASTATIATNTLRFMKLLLPSLPIHFTEQNPGMIAGDPRRAPILPNCRAYNAHFFASETST
jgi:hypothetical protein